MIEVKYVCPICGFPELSEPPRNEFGVPSFDMCNCCGVEFGYEDCTPDEIIKYREKWIKDGCKWALEDDKPANWSLEEQLKNIL